MTLFNGCEPGRYRNREGWLPRRPWPASARIQFGRDISDRFAFFEVFMDAPDPRFHRGEGADVEAAEDDAWAGLERWRACEHDWVRRDGGKAGSTDSCGRCTKCGGVQTSLFPPMTTCVVCGVPTSKHLDRAGAYLCEEHGNFRVLPRERWREAHWHAYMRDLARRPTIADMEGQEESVWAYMLRPWAEPPDDIPSEIALFEAELDARKGL